MCPAIREVISRADTCLQLFDSVGYELVRSSLVHRRQPLRVALDWEEEEEDSVRLRVW
jgi:hypothetical protein